MRHDRTWRGVNFELLPENHQLINLLSLFFLQAVTVTVCPTLPIEHVRNKALGDSSRKAI
jgi:hypothetical protein